MFAGRRKRNEGDAAVQGENHLQNTAPSCRSGDAAEHSGSVRGWRGRSAKRRGRELGVGIQS